MVSVPGLGQGQGRGCVLPQSSLRVQAGVIFFVVMKFIGAVLTPCSTLCLAVTAVLCAGCLQF